MIEFLPLHEDTKTPHYATSGSAGADLFAHNFKMLFTSSNATPIKEDAMKDWSQLTIGPGERALIGTGFKVAIPMGYEMQIRPRSGNALKKGLTVLNSPGTIDCDYRGEVGVILINEGFDAVVVEKGDAIAQAVIAQYEHMQYLPVKELSDTQRGEGGFGSTNK